jgi:SAM-dependent methyltransferase
VLLDRLAAESAFAAVALGTALLALVCGGSRVPGALLLGLAGWAMSAPPPALHAVAQNVGLGERGPLLQNRHGIVHTSDDPLGEIVYGGNAYDGRFVLDMANNSNGLDRAYLMAVLHPRPRRVLLIGLGGGAWLSAIAGLPGIERIDVVELNPAYLQLIAERPAVAAALRDPRVRVQVDDGRRWLRRRPELRYDLVFSNTSFHWRSHVGLLLSQEFMQLVRARLAPGGILAFNTTGSLDALHTAQQNFAHALRYRNFAFASDLPLQRQPGAEALLRRARLGGQAAFGDAQFAPGRVGHRLLHEPLQPAQVLTAGKAVQLIRDADPVNEYRHGQAPLFGALNGWLPARP